MLNSRLRIRGAESAQDRQGVQALLASQFEVRPGLGTRFARLYDWMFAGDWGVAHTFSRVAVVNGEVVGHALLVPRYFWVEGTEFSGGIVAMVVVHRDFTRRGIGSALMEDAEALARRKGLLMLHLAGDPGFYSRFGYVDAYLRCSATLPVLTPPGSVNDLHNVAEADIPELVRLSRAERLAGGVNPTQSRWRWLLKTGHPFGLLEKNDTLLGFLAEEDFCLVLKDGAETRGFLRAAGGGDNLAIYEAGSESREAAGELLSAASALALERQCEKISFHLPPTNRLMQAAEEGGGRIQIDPDPELLVKILDVSSLMMRLRPVLELRWVRAEISRSRARIVLSSGEDRVLLAFEGKALRVQAKPPAGEEADWRVTLPEIGLARAILGTDALAERIAHQSVESDLLELHQRDFPGQEPIFLAE